MSFGKREREVRGWQEPSTSNADIAAVINREPRNGKDLNGDSGTGTLVTVALASVLVAIGVFGALLFTGAIGGSGAAVVANPDLRTKVEDSCNTGAPTALPDEFEVAFMGVEGEAIPRKADYLNCLMTRQTQRFCAADERKVMAAQLKAYFKYYHGKKVSREVAHSMPMGRNVTKLFEKIQDRIKEDSGIEAPRKPAEADPGVISTMQQLVRDGYLGDGDFGWALPSYMTPHFEGVTKEKNSC